MRCEVDAFVTIPPSVTPRLVWLIGLLMVGLMVLAGTGCRSTTSTGPGPNSTAATGKGKKKIPGELPIRTLVRSSVGASFKAPVESAKIGRVVLQDRLRTLVVSNSPLSRAVRGGGGPHAVGAGAGGPAFEALLDAEGLPAPSLGKLDFYVDGHRFFPLYLRALQSARRSIDVHTFIFDTDDFAVKVADVLRAKSQQIPVRVLFDGIGSDAAAEIIPDSQPASFTGPKSMAQYLGSPGAGQLTVRRTGNAFLLADHSKLHIIDGDYAFTGGMNLGREYRHDWHDLMVRVQGPILTDLQDLYERRWRSDAWWHKLQRRPKNQSSSSSPSESGSASPSPSGTGPNATTPAAPTARELQPLRLLLTDARNSRRDIFKATLLGIRSAKQRVWIQTPYFSSDEITEALGEALARGVQVRIIVPQEVDQKIMQANNAADLIKLIEKGAQLYAYPGMTHLKATVCDDWAMFGTANYDTLSQRINNELNFATSDPRTVNALVNRVFLPDFRTARRLTPALLKSQASAGAEFVGDQL